MDLALEELIKSQRGSDRRAKKKADPVKGQRAVSRGRMDTALDHLLTGTASKRGQQRKRARSEQGARVIKTGGKRKSAPAISAGGKNNTNGRMRGNNGPSSSSSSRSKPIISVGAPIIISKRGNAFAGGETAPQSRTPRRVAESNSRPSVQVARKSKPSPRITTTTTDTLLPLSESERLQAARIKIITQLEKVPTPTSALQRNFAASSVSSQHRFHHDPLTLSERFLTQ